MEKGIDISSRFSITEGPSKADLSTLLDFLCSGGIPPKKSVFHVRADVSNEPDRVYEKPAKPFRISNAIPLRITQMRNEKTLNTQGDRCLQSLYEFEGEALDDVQIAHVQLTKTSVLRGIYNALTGTGYIEVVSIS